MFTGGSRGKKKTPIQYCRNHELKLADKISRSTATSHIRCPRYLASTNLLLPGGWMPRKPVNICNKTSITRRGHYLQVFVLGMYNFSGLGKKHSQWEKRPHTQFSRLANDFYSILDIPATNLFHQASIGSDL
jgi:hypothetical protein